MAERRNPRTYARRPQPGPRRRVRRRPKSRFYLLLALLVLILAAGIALAALLIPVRDRPAEPAGPTADIAASDSLTLPAAAPVEENVSVPQTQTTDLQPASERAALLAAQLNEEGSNLEALSQEEMVVVEDLSINPDLPEEWLNVLLLGSDERVDGQSARTDAMLICSINLTDGSVKLTSILRDLAVEFDELGELSGVYRINAANYFGNEALAMKVVNECFGMNIQYYVRVNFFGFQQVAHQLGGIDVDITEEEMEQINHNIVEQYKFAVKAGINDDNLPKELLTTYGVETHLDGRQTLGYARIRKTNGGDYMRAERQRTVLVKLMEKLKDADAATLMNVVTAAMPYVRTNLSAATIISVATSVVVNGVDSVETMRVPVSGTYVEDTRNGQSMLYDCDWAANRSELYSFIYD